MTISRSADGVIAPPALALAVAFLLAPSPVPSSSSPPSAPAGVWQGVTLGEPIASAVARLGPPLSRRKAIMGTYIYEYRALDGEGTLTITAGAETVTGIRLSADDPSAVRPPVVDPFGVTIGDSADRLTELRGLPQRYDDEGDGEFTSYYGKPSEVRWTYGLRDGRVASIGVIAAYRIVRATGAVVSVPTPRPSNAPTPQPPDASGLERAIKVTPEELDKDPQFEYTYVRAMPCGTDDRWSPMSETILNEHRRNYSRIDAVCPSTGQTKSFYFDITAVFGRAEQ